MENTTKLIFLVVSTILALNEVLAMNHNPASSDSSDIYSAIEDSSNESGGTHYEPEYEENEEIAFASINALTVFLNKGTFQLNIEENSYKGKLADFKTLTVAGITHKISEITVVGLAEKKSPEKHKQFIEEHRKGWKHFLKQISHYEIEILDLSNEIPREFWKLLRDHIFDNSITNVQQLFVQSRHFPDEFNGLESLIEMSFAWDAPRDAVEYTNEIVDNILTVVENNPSLKRLDFCRSSDALFANLIQILSQRPSLELHFGAHRKLLLENNALRLAMGSDVDNTAMDSIDFNEWNVKRIEIELLSLSALAPSVPFFSDSKVDTLAIVAMHKCGGDIVKAFVRFMEYLPNKEIYLVESIKTLVLPHNGSMQSSENLLELRGNIWSLRQIFRNLTSLVIKMSHRFNVRDASFVCPYRVVDVGSNFLHCNPNPSDDLADKKPTTKMPNVQRKPGNQLGGKRPADLLINKGANPPVVSTSKPRPQAKSPARGVAFFGNTPAKA